MDLEKRPARRTGGRKSATGSKKTRSFEFLESDWATPRVSAGLTKVTLTVVAFILDLLLHSAMGLAVWNSLAHSPEPPWKPIMLGVLAGVAASFVHRVFVQRLIRTTLGKALFGLRLREEDGSYPTLWRLIEQWFVGSFLTIATPLQILG
ncbi:RDD family protein [Nocardia sp. NBC_01329]|uniref:RDD family protein n=1 Tax=Nocardia sp. NBC_01329 TaxID=2903594 RepID=UPI002E13380E|nr:RDD family protein [Nocardia sp. NBC_01329]